ncbi:MULTISPECIES: helix-turn-helix domain-containing protein [unclassified Gordonia (in: high G+C Gram-positive bacteria)]|uniref:helix-turn-helix domain-containing protein n=1 Tax=Gordonia TaxID=2053 RepID=UPI00071E1CF6|nr:MULTISPECIES: helix-turn-helix domain-containing protein [unclassified Gordonia (in: high G+C Gram-positive bacteria)]MCZ4536357.1 helix-turn-helix domain-containing protein [Gordonia terrae]KSU53336.1 excisionase [Gordonia sp. SGD-V-85]MBR7193069.1 helix-turn-helix domain-containing protein [Gordonia sp. SCSIO 19800]MCX2756313.1 helix-turn-helix domain-containing protein [Gordonia sp. 4N]MDT0219881.1 helix-turn-helix domain-containing protein [Gordonia sp. AC31]
MSPTTAPRRTGTFFPPTDAPDLDALMDLSRFLDHHHEPAALVGPDGEEVPLPLEVYRTLTQIVDAMRAHRAVVVAPVDQKLSTQESADYLGISRPTLIKLLESGRIPYETVEGSRHRRVKLGDLLEYQSQRAIERRGALQALVDDAEDSGLYDVPAEDYREAMRTSRREIAEERKR